MRSVAGVLQMLVRLLGLVQIVLGLLFWFGVARGLIDLHMLFGIALVLMLWVLAVVGAAARVGAVLPLVAFAVGAVTVWLGLTQTQLLPGDAHWVVQVLHLAVGLAAIGTADALGRRIKRGGTAAAPAAEDR
jgi:hypothetical protein